MDILIRPPSGSPLVRGFLSGDPQAARFYPSGSPGVLGSYQTKAEEVSAAISADARLLLTRVLQGGGADREAKLQAFREREGFAVTTGQQPGLFGGPLFTLYKALTAAALARRLEAHLHRPVLPIFWVAAEDHDWEEVRRTWLLDPENVWTSVEIPVPAGSEYAPLHRVKLGSELDAAREQFLKLLPDSDFAAQWRDLLQQTYRAGETLPGAFARMLESLLAPFGVFVLSPEHPALQEASLPLLLHELDRSEEIEAGLTELGHSLEDQGFSLQVPRLPGGTNLFFEGTEGRDRIYREGSGFRLRRAGTRMSREELRERALADPAVLSPNVLLRPVVESTLIPTLSYVAGPGEMNYFAQVTPVFRAHGRTPPVIHPRLSAHLVETKVGKVLGKFGLAAEELARPHHELATALLREEMPPAIRSAIGGFRGSVAQSAKALSEAVRPLDPTLSGPVDHLRSQSFALLQEVEKKVMQALKRENDVALAQLEKARWHLFPEGTPQERVFSPFYYLFRYGPALLDRLRDQAEGELLLGPPEVSPSTNRSSSDSGRSGGGTEG